MITAKGPVIWREKEDRGDPDLDCLGLGFTECQTYWYEVAADLYVVCEERGRRTAGLWHHVRSGLLRGRL